MQSIKYSLAKQLDKLAIENFNNKLNTSKKKSQRDYKS